MADWLLAQADKVASEAVMLKQQLAMLQQMQEENAKWVGLTQHVKCNQHDVLMAQCFAALCAILYITTVRATPPQSQSTPHVGMFHSVLYFDTAVDSRQLAC